MIRETLKPDGAGAPRRTERETAGRVEEFRQAVIEVGVREILSARDEEITEVAKRLEAEFGAVSLTPKEQMATNPDFCRFIELGYEKRRLVKEVLPEGVVTILSHAERIAERSAYLDAAQVLSSIWEEVRKEDEINRHFTEEHGRYQVEKQKAIDRVQRIIDLYEEKGLTEEGSQQILELLGHRKECAEEDIRQHAERTSWLVHNLEPLIKKARTATQILAAGAKIPSEEIARIGAPFLAELEE